MKGFLMYDCTLISNNTKHLILLCDDGSFIKLYERGEDIPPLGQRLQIGVDRKGWFYINAWGSVREVPDLTFVQRSEGKVVMHNLKKGFGFIRESHGKDLHFLVFDLADNLQRAKLKGEKLKYLVARISEKKRSAIFIQRAV